MPLSEIVFLDQLEEEFRKKAIPSDPEAWEFLLEQEAHDYAVETTQKTEALQAYQGRGSQIRVGRALRAKLVPILALQLEALTAVGKRSGLSHNIVMPMLEHLNRDYQTIAHITVTIVLDCVGYGLTMDRTAVSMQGRIGERLDDQAFLEHLKKKSQRLEPDQPVVPQEQRLDLQPQGWSG